MLSKVAFTTYIYALFCLWCRKRLGIADSSQYCLQCSLCTHTTLNGVSMTHHNGMMFRYYVGGRTQFLPTYTLILIFSVFVQLIHWLFQKMDCFYIFSLSLIEVDIALVLFIPTPTQVVKTFLKIMNLCGRKGPLLTPRGRKWNIEYTHKYLITQSYAAERLIKGMLSPFSQSCVVISWTNYVQDFWIMSIDRFINYNNTSV